MILIGYYPVPVSHIREKLCAFSLPGRSLVAKIMLTSMANMEIKLVVYQIMLSVDFSRLAIPYKVLWLS